MSDSCTPACHQAGDLTAAHTSAHHIPAAHAAAAQQTEVVQDAMPDDDIGWPR
ncbi:hypothetical protein [Streptomyces sp. NPDC051183]|uniref:hypothetical protein n=1 Tax=unclassified Streptomyces TaxID=2593676 RepID=UPI00343E477E